jgi:branched-chain amino acid transport system substrate-binding protein
MSLIGNGSGAPVPDDEWSTWAYRVNPVAKTATPAFLKTVIKAEKFKRLAVIYDQTQDAHVGDAHICEQLAGELGYEIVSFEAYRSGDQDFSSQLTNVRLNKPDAVWVAASTGDGVRVVTQIREMGIEVPLLAGYGAFFDTVYWDGTDGGIQGGYTWMAYDLARAEGHLKSWLELYNKTFKLTVTSYSLHGYNAVHTIADCIRQAGSTDRGAIKEVLSSLDFNAPLGNRISFKNPPNGENLTPDLTIIKIDGRASGMKIT